MLTPALLTNSVADSARLFLQMVFGHFRPRDFAVELWDGEQWPPEPNRPADFKLVFRSPNVVRGMFSEASALSFAEAYIYGHLHVEGSLIDVFESADRLLTLHYPAAEKLRLARWLWSIPAPKYPRQGTFSGFVNRFASTAARIRAAVNYHYDHSVDFWKLWLDESLSYSCAYFETPETSLAEAQTGKLDYICRKLRLQPGQRLLDMGCGWGALIRHAAAHYGVETLGLTLSPHQAEVARERFHAAGLASKCRVDVTNFLEFQPRENFDRIASIGAAEHVPEKCFDDYFARAFALLQPGGQFLHHAIVRIPSADERPGCSFMDRYVFPEHFLATIGRTVTAAEAAGFEARDVESLREHYKLTLEHWLRRFESAQGAIERETDPLTFRVFRLYLAGSAYEFRRGRLSIYQTLLAKPENGRSGLPLTRADWYRRVSAAQVS
ncbi:MAG TPA: cyclopropane-fatty-acyl-phospholipid synthase family protein [Terriglobales bacterium]|nr:cyclopropane-fatty-acyl-phospholipid synthase family protein [Terriglobales bacterium]